MALPDQREEVFARIREALRQPAPHHHAAHTPGAAEANAVDDGLPAADAFRAWLPQVGDSVQDQIELFARNAAQLKAEFYPVAHLAAAAQQIRQLADEAQWKRLATHGQSLAANLAASLNLPTLRTDGGYIISELEECDAAITDCDCLIAQTGSVMISSHSAGGRALSVLPPHHIVIARRSQMVSDLTAAFQLANKSYAPKWPSFLGFVTGPSRTGDIERILVLGAHGPKRLTIFLLES